MYGTPVQKSPPVRRVERRCTPLKTPGALQVEIAGRLRKPADHRGFPCSARRTGLPSKSCSANPSLRHLRFCDSSLRSGLAACVLLIRLGGFLQPWVTMHSPRPGAASSHEGPYDCAGAPPRASRVPSPQLFAPPQLPRGRPRTWVLAWGAGCTEKCRNEIVLFRFQFLPRRGHHRPLHCPAYICPPATCRQHQPARLRGRAR